MTIQSTKGERNALGTFELFIFTVVKILLLTKERVVLICLNTV